MLIEKLQCQQKNYLCTLFCEARRQRKIFGVSIIKVFENDYEYSN